MRCPNCRCVVPERMTYCGYCGYEFLSGVAKTLTVDESYADRFYGEPNYYNRYDYPQNTAYDNYYGRYGYSRELSYDKYSGRCGYSQDLAYESFYGGYGYRQPQQTGNADSLSLEAELALVAGTGVVFLLIFTAILIFLI